MDFSSLKPDLQRAIQECLGYLNYSAGASDPAFLKNLNEFHAYCVEQDGAFLRSGMLERFLDSIAALQGTNDAFRSLEQAATVADLTLNRVLPAYRDFHADLLFHQTETGLFQPFFVGRAFEAVLAQGSPWSDTERIVAGAMRRLNDYVGYRPVAVLHNQQKMQPYAHEFFRPIPCYVHGAGSAHGPYKEIVDEALGILREVDPQILFAACFPIEQLDELAYDPRAYDFDHPVQRRPNYLFGQWDMHCLDNAGRSRRYVVQQEALDAMLSRVGAIKSVSREELIFEAGAVLAGTILMGAGTSGASPDAFDSEITLSKLVQKIASYRDEFYDKLTLSVQGPHAERLRAEAEELKQPFGGARQSFNQYLAMRRAKQLQHVSLAHLYSRMGYLEASREEVNVVPVASARMNCEMRCLMSSSHRRLRAGALDSAFDLMTQLEAVLHRGIECGAVVDPWNILGFGAQFSLFPSPENSIADHRIDNLLDLISDIFAAYVRILKEASARGDDPLREAILDRMRAFASWWDQYASVEVGSIIGVSGRENVEAAENVGESLRAWHGAGAAAGDIAFWRSHVERFTSAKAYALVVDTLLDHRDPVAAMALLMQWLSQAEEIPLVEETYSFQDLALLWMEDLWAPASRSTENPGSDFPPPSGEKELPFDEKMKLARKFVDYLEANAGAYWNVPELELDGLADRLAEEFADEDGLDEDGLGDEEDEEGDEEDEESGIFSAAYEQMVFRDSADDGVEGPVYETNEPLSDFELAYESERLSGHLTFHSTLAQIWKIVAVSFRDAHGAPKERDEVLGVWLEQATKNYKGLLKLLDDVHRYKIPAPRGTHDSMVEYDQRRGVKEALTETIIAAGVDVIDAAWMLRAAMSETPKNAASTEKWEEAAVEVLRGILTSDAASVRKHWKKLVTSLRKEPLLYISLVRGGRPDVIVRSRGMQTMLRRLLAYAPRLGLLNETLQLVRTIQRVEVENPMGPGAITEFDRIFAIACRSIVRCEVKSSTAWSEGKKTPGVLSRDMELIELLDETAEVLLECWLMHSQSVRLSVLESVSDEYRWREVKEFIEDYGADLFTQQFMTFSNLRAIVLQGPENWIRALEELPEEEREYEFLKELDGKLDRRQVAVTLGLIIEAILENYAVYADYNTITTQSDRGELLYTLLDFLRLRAHYDRVAWNLRPIMIIHDVLVREGRDEAARIWRDAVTDRTSGVSKSCLQRYRYLTKKYGMRLPSIAERLDEQFYQPLQVDQLCAAVEPTMREIREGGKLESFPKLQKLVSELTKRATGSGLETPEWLAALEEEVAQVETPTLLDESPDLYLDLPQTELTPAEVKKQVAKLGRFGFFN